MGEINEGMTKAISVEISKEIPGKILERISECILLGIVKRSPIKNEGEIPTGLPEEILEGISGETPE